MNEWHCYIFEFANADQLVTKQEFWRDYTFKITVSILDFEMESGYDFVRLYANSQFEGDAFSGSLEDMPSEQRQKVYRVDFKYLDQWQEDDIPSFELCLNVRTDSSVTAKGFEIATKIEYENPEIVTWTEPTECRVQAPSWRNPARWDGLCGIGVSERSILQCDEELLSKLELVEGGRNTPGHILKKEEERQLEESGLYRGVCSQGEVERTFCNKMDCGEKDVDVLNEEVVKNPKLKFHFSGHGRIDPAYPDPFTVERSMNRQIDLDAMISGIQEMRDAIGAEYEDVRVLTNSVQQHSKMEDSKIRLGLKLARSLILGDTFHAAFTGSSNTAGHDNMFMSSYPMQFQSMMRPLWRSIGYKGAAFRVSNRAIGGAIGTDQLAWCIPEITGGNAEKIDVVFWESIMNDAGSDDSRKHTMEEHLRNALSLFGGTFNGNVPNRPLWHAVIAGSNGMRPFDFDEKAKPIYRGYSDLIEQYSDFGAGMVEFNPSMGMNPMKKAQPENWSDEHFYVTWHPGPAGHRIYAEILAYFYLDAALSVLADIKETMADLEKTLNMSIARPVLEMLDLLQDAPYEAGLPPPSESKKCQPICTDAMNSYCLLGFNPKDSVYEISKYVLEPNGWRYENVAGNPQPIDNEDGGQASVDTKFGYKGNKESGELVLSVKIAGNKYLMVEKPYADWGGLNDILKNMRSWFRVEIKEVLDIVVTKAEDQKKKESIKQQQTGKVLKCETEDQQLWNRDIMNFGCILKFEYSGKYKVAFTVETEEDIPICVIASF